MAEGLVSLLTLYAVCGVLFAVPFAWKGAPRIDPNARDATRGFRLLVLPGAAALWPWLLRLWIKAEKTSS